MARTNTHRGRAGRRLLAGALSFVMLCALLPAQTFAPATAAGSTWLQPYLEKLVSWGVMRGDQEGNLDPDREITRSEYVSLINRAFGYDRAGTIPFSDVTASDWYYDDIRVGYSTGYFAGTSPRTAAPLNTLTREQAVVILARNLMLQESLGETLTFTDSRALSDWSRGLVKSAAEQGVVKGYPDGSFQPQRNITRGEVAVLLTDAVGTPIRQAGDYTLGSVYGNVTISTSGVTLRNTVIAGDLYLTGGVGQGYVTLENVTVLGKIMASGAGEANKGENSIILRNVTAPAMVVDSISNQFVTVRAEGDTKIASTSVRTPSYLEDTTDDDYGFALVELRGEDGTSLDLAGNIKEVTVLTPSATVAVARGTAQVLTVDESAVGAAVTVGSGAEVKTLNLDVGTRVDGRGDVEELFVNAAGSSTAMLPDKITVRPGLTANVDGESMDTVTAAESSEDPRLLSGYPRAIDLAPTSATALFRTNKRGTIYWAVSSITDGSVGEEDLIDPPSFSTKILKHGKIDARASNTDETAKLTGLTSDGSYYLSAVLVDSRDQRSSVKVTAFTTPDNTTPNFASGYPALSKITDKSAQASVMPTKSCRLYYALLPKGAAAPKPEDFKSNAVTGNLGFGSLDVTKNTVRVFTVNDTALQELVSYDLYLWLTDVDGGKSSAVKKLSFTTVDRTPPEFVHGPTVNAIKETSVGLTAALNESGTVYWAVVKQGEEYPKPLAGQTAKPDLDSDTAKLQVSSGMNALKSGKVSASPNKDLTLNISGLKAQTAYDLYYVAQDKAGNYSRTVMKMTIHTLDTEPPAVSQEFTRTNDQAGKQPLPDTDVRILFSEGIQDLGGQVLYDLYLKTVDTGSTDAQRATALADLVRLLKKDFILYDMSSYPYVAVPEYSQGRTGHWIDYSKVTIAMEDGKTVVTFSYDKGAIRLNSGATYRFDIADIADTSDNKNQLKPNPYHLPEFTTVFARVNLVDQGVSNGPYQRGGGTDLARVDMSFQMHPVSTGAVADALHYDVFLWSDSIVYFDLYYRVTDKTPAEGASSPAYVTGTDAMLQGKGAAPDGHGWVYLGNGKLTPDETAKERVGTSVRRLVTGGAATTAFPKLNTLDSDCDYEYAISLTQVGTLTDPTTWSKLVKMQVTLPAGSDNNVGNLAALIDQRTWSDAVTQNRIQSIGTPEDFSVSKQFTDTTVPKFTAGYPTFDAGDSFVTMHFQLDRPGTVYYALAPVLPKGSAADEWAYTLTTLDTATPAQPVKPDQVPKDGTEALNKSPALSTPVNLDIYQPNFTSARIKHGSQKITVGVSDVRLDGLETETLYYVYLVLKGDSQNLSQVQLYQFKTTKADVPQIVLTNRSPSVLFRTSTDAVLDYALVAYKSVPAVLTSPFSGVADTGDYSGSVKDDIESEANKSQDGDKSSFSILDAMLTTDPNAPDYSVFDSYAKAPEANTIRKDVAEYIRYKDPDSATAPLVRGTLGDMKAGSDQAVNFLKNMTFGTQYFCLATAHNVQGTVDSFKAVKNVHTPDTTPPEFERVQTTITAAYDASGDPVDAKSPDAVTFDGTLTIIFDEPIYFIGKNDADQIAIPVWMSQLTYKLDPTDRSFVYLHNHAASTFTYTSRDTTAPTSIFQLKFTKVSAGAFLAMFDDGFLSDADSNSASKDGASGKKLLLTFKTDAKQSEMEAGYTGKLDPVIGPAFVFSWQ